MTIPADPREEQTRIPQQPAPPSPTFAATPPAVRKRRRWPWIAAAVVVVLAVAIGIGSWAALRPSTSDQAVTACQDIITEQLRSPATAQFTGMRIESRGVDYFYVEGQVDSQNGFGATVRTTFSCELHTPDGGESWRNNGVKVD